MTTGTLSIVCPACAATLKLKDQSALGKRVPCPKCKQPFVLERPQEVPIAEVIDEPADEYDEFADFDVAAKPKRSSGNSANEGDDEFDDFDSLPKARLVKKTVAKKKKTATKAKPKKPSVRLDEFPEFGGVGAAITYGVIAGLIGASAWAAVGYFTGYEIGWLAWGIGFACGSAVGSASNTVDEFTSGAIAVVCALGAIAVGKYLAVYFFVRDLVGQELADEVSLLKAMIVTLHPMDLLWIFLASATAYKLGSGNGEE